MSVAKIIAACRRTSPTRSPPAKSSSARPRSSRSSSRTRSMPVRGGSSIHVELGGKKQVRVEDDGEGMEPDDARLAIERHATSKIRRADDLAAIRTLGFRGEALPSIASVSHFVLRTRARGQQSGTEIRVNGGTVASVMEVGAAEGTVVEVNDLFYNLPARRKFLKSDGAESAQVSRVVTQLALAYPEVGFTLTSARPDAASVSAGGVAARSPVSDLRRARRSDRGREERRRPPAHRLHRGAGRSRGRRAAPSTSSSTGGSSRTGRSRTRFSTPTAWRRSRNAARSASVSRDAARRGRRQRASDEGRGPLPRAVAGSRGGAAGADGRARPAERAAAAAAAGDAPSTIRSRPRSPAFSPAACIRTDGCRSTPLRRRVRLQPDRLEPSSDPAAARTSTPAASTPTSGR